LQRPWSAADPAAGALLGAGEDLDEGGLARPVLADDAMHRVAPDRQAYVLEGLHAGILLAEVADLQDVPVADYLASAAGVIRCRTQAYQK
jgi:hypothetical protein